MVVYVLVVLVALGGSLSITPLVKRLAPLLGAIDRPGSPLKIHKTPIPRLGGLAIFVGFVLAGIWGWRSLNPMASQTKGEMLGLLLGGAVILILGAIDDVRELMPGPKFLGQGIAVAVLVWVGVRMNVSPAWIAIPFTGFYVLGACNALNLLDGVDGLAAGVSAIASGMFFVLFLSQGDALGAVISLALLGSCVGFLWHNFHPASIFMGDCGSMFLGYMLAVMAILYSRSSQGLALLVVPVAVLGVPVFDTFLTLLRRSLNHKPLFPGDRGHFYDRLMEKGLSQKQTVLIAYGLGTLFGLTALVLTEVPVTPALIILGCEILGVAAMVLKMDMLDLHRG